MSQQNFSLRNVQNILLLQTYTELQKIISISWTIENYQIQPWNQSLYKGHA